MSITIYHGSFDKSINDVFHDMMPSVRQIAIQREESSGSMHIQWMGDSDSILDNIAAGFLRTAVGEHVLSDRARYIGYAVKMFASRDTVMASTIKDEDGLPSQSFLDDVMAAVGEAHKGSIEKIRKAILAASALILVAAAAGGMAWVATQPVDREGMRETTEVTKRMMDRIEQEASINRNMEDRPPDYFSK